MKNRGSKSNKTRRIERAQAREFERKRRTNIEQMRLIYERPGTSLKEAKRLLDSMTVQERDQLVEIRKLYDEEVNGRCCWNQTRDSGDDDFSRTDGVLRFNMGVIN